VVRVRLNEITRQWDLECRDHPPIRARIVVLAVDMSRVPIIPRWPGLETFRGPVMLRRQPVPISCGTFCPWAI